MLLGSQPLRAGGAERALLRRPRLDVVVIEVVDWIACELVVRRAVHEAERGSGEPNGIRVALNDAVVNLLQGASRADQLLDVENQLIGTDDLALPVLELLLAFLPLLSKAVLGAEKLGDFIRQRRRGVVRPDDPVGIG